jgi:hypothetical protein
MSKDRAARFALAAAVARDLVRMRPDLHPVGLLAPELDVSAADMAAPLVSRGAADRPGLDRMEKPRPGIFDTGTTTPRSRRPTIPGGWFPEEEE